MGLHPVWPLAGPEPEGSLARGGADSPHRRVRARRVLILAGVAALVPALAVSQLVHAFEAGLTTVAASAEIVRVLADDAGHRLDRGHVREVEVGIDGTVWVAVGRRVLALGTPGAIEPRAREWKAFPRRLSVHSDGSLWAVEDGGRSVALTEAGWTQLEPPLPGAEDAPVLEPAALEQLRAAGIEHLPQVLASAVGPDQQRWLVVDVGERPDERPAQYRLLRSAGSSWTVVGPDEGLPRDPRRAWIGPGPESSVALTVDQAGRAWFSLGHHGLWIADADGVTRVRFPGLGTGALDLAGTPDGAIWIASIRGGLFRWSPAEPAAR